jgi:serine/threonine protein kinase
MLTSYLTIDFRQLANICLQYRHCFVRSFGWYQVDSVLCIVMEYLDGGDLSTYISQAFQEAEAARIARQLLEGLNFMHRSGFAHRDLKPKVMNDFPDIGLDLLISE